MNSFPQNGNQGGQGSCFAWATTYYQSWYYKQIQNQPGQSSRFAGQSIAYDLNSTAGAHAMSLVGYDDSIWVGFIRFVSPHDRGRRIFCHRPSSVNKK